MLTNDSYKIYWAQNVYHKGAQRLIKLNPFIPQNPLSLLQYMKDIFSDGI